MQGEAGANQQSLNFVPFPWHREGRKAAALLIVINTVTSHLLLPNKETGEAADLSLLLEVLKDLKVQLGLVFNISPRALILPIQGLHY